MGTPAAQGGQPWVELDIEPEAPSTLLDSRPVCYVLEDYGLSNALILDRACQAAGLPSPLLPLPVPGDPLRRKRASWPCRGASPAR